jgi:hypothetical protein
MIVVAGGTLAWADPYDLAHGMAERALASLVGSLPPGDRRRQT